MIEELTTGGVLAVLFLATLVRSTFGFGEALIAVPLLALLIPVEVAVPLATLVSITVAGIVVLQDRATSIGGSVSDNLVLSTFVGIPFGLGLLTLVAEPVMKTVLTVIIMSFSAYCLLGRNRLHLKDDRQAWLFGFAGGVLGGPTA